MGLGSEILLIATLIKNNEARLISYIDYEMETVTLLAVLTHKEYDKGGWKSTCNRLFPFAYSMYLIPSSPAVLVRWLSFVKRTEHPVTSWP